MISKQAIIDHYKRPEVKDTIIRISRAQEGTRAGMKCTPNAYVDKNTRELKDLMDWYRGTGPYTKRKFLKKVDLSTGKEGITQNVNRTLYWTLNIFDSAIYEVDFKKVEKAESAGISRQHTTGYTFGIDIDREHGNDIHNPEVKKAVEDMAQFYCNELIKYAPNSVYVAYSGGGIYVYVHHGVFNEYFKDKTAEGWDYKLLALLDAFDNLIGDIRDRFFKEYPEHKGKVKPDQLNGSQRVFKTLYSLHKSLDYAVIPLNKDCVKIDFESAKLPLKADILEAGKDWYTKYDEDGKFLEYLKPYLEKSIEKREKRASLNSEVEAAANPIDFDKWAPCMKNIYNLPTCGEGKTRALAILVSFLGQIGYGEDEARAIFNEVADRWGATKSNIFESYYLTMHVPSCERLMSNDKTGFPKGVSIKGLGVCKQDIRCMNIPSPRYYTDSEANKKRLLTPKA